MNLRCIPKPDGVIEVTAPDGHTGHIMQTLLYADNHVGQDVACIADHLKGDSLEETGRAIWKFIRQHIEYRRDELGDEQIKSPAATWHDAHADCKSMSLFAAALLKNMQIPHRYRFVSFNDVQQPTHVYIMAGEYGEIVIDTVNDEFNKEEEYTYFWDYKAAMTRVSWIHETKSKANGASAVHTDRSPSRQPAYTQDIPTREERLRDAPRIIKREKPFINWLDKSSGELSLILLREQIKIARAYYGDQGNSLGMAEHLIDRVLENNVHRNASQILPDNLPDDIMWVGNEIKAASVKTKPAGGIRIEAEKMEEHRVPGIGMSMSGIGQNGSVVPESFQKQVLFECLDEYSELDLRGKSPDDFTLAELEHHAETRRAHDQLAVICYEQLKMLNLLNKHMEDSGHHLLYEFLQKNLNQVPQIVTYKTLRHRGVTTALSKISRFERNNVAMWLKTGVMRNNAKEGIEPFTPEETIQRIIAGADLEGIPTVKELYQSGGVNRIGGLGQTVTSIVNVLVKVIKIVGQFLGLIRGRTAQKELLDEYKNAGTPEFSADPKGDWATGSGQNGSSGGGFVMQGSLLPLLLGGVGLAMISPGFSKSKK